MGDLDEADRTGDEPLAAGGFSSWLVGMQDALGGERGSDVPCGGCTACCRSSQFIHIGPDEVETLAHIPAELLFPAPLLPTGNVLLGYDERGHCPMLLDEKCSIYEHRPRTCRTYDCRVFPATGVEIDDVDQLPIARQARRWRFAFPAEADQVSHDGMCAAATFIRDQQNLLPEGFVPTNATQHAVLAVHLHDLFVRRHDEDGSLVLDPGPDAILAALGTPMRPAPEM